MKRSKFTEEQITYALRQHDAGTPVGDICRQLGASEASFYVWKKKYAHMGVSELRELRQLPGRECPAEANGFRARSAVRCTSVPHFDGDRSVES